MEDEKIIIHAKLPDLDAVQNDFTRRVGERICFDSSVDIYSGLIFPILERGNLTYYLE